MTLEMNRRNFVGKSAVAGAGLAMAGPLSAFAQRGGRDSAEGYGPLVLKRSQNGPETLFLPEDFEFVTLDRQGTPMDDGNITPGIFDGMGAFEGRGRTTVLIRNTENRERPGEIPVIVPEDEAYDETTIAGDVKLVVRRARRRGGKRFEPPVVEEKFAILGGISTACAGGMLDDLWITCEEVVKRTGEKHGYSFEIDSRANGPVKARPIRAAGRFSHEAVAFLDGILYQTEDRNNRSDGGAAFYRYLPNADRDDFEDEDDDLDDDERERLAREERRRTERDADGQSQGDPEARERDREARREARDQEEDRDRDGARARRENDDDRDDDDRDDRDDDDDDDDDHGGNGRDGRDGEDGRDGADGRRDDEQDDEDDEDDDD